MAKKGKQAKTGMTKRQRWRIVNWTMYGLTAVIAAAMLYSVVVMHTPRATRQQTRLIDEQAAQPSSSSAPAKCPERGGQDWEYDVATNCYFDPSPGHRHWHSGHPPEPAERAERMAQTAPAPIPAQPMPPPGSSAPP